MSHLTFDNLNEHFKLNILCKIFVLLCFCSYTLQAKTTAKTTIELLDGKILLSEAKLTYKHARLKITTKTQIWEITAAQIDYYFDKHQMLIQDHASMKSDDIEITAEKILLHTDTGLVEIEKGTIFDSKNKVQITAKQILQKKKNVYKVTKAFLTSCIVGADSIYQTWKIYSENLDYFVDDYAFGVNNVFYLRNIPVFYAPVGGWPTGSKRKSGFLAPRLSYNDLPRAESYGLQIKIPYFWALDPYTNYTLGLDFRQKRGLGLDSQFYKVGKTKPAHTIINWWYLPEIVSQRKENKTNVLSHRYFIDAFYYELLRKNSNLFLASYFASDSKIATDYQLSLAQNEKIATENKLFVDFRWKNGTAYLQAKQNIEFADDSHYKPNSQQAPTNQGRLHLEHNYSNKYLQARFVENLEQFSIKKDWEGVRQISEVSSNFFFQNAIFFVEPRASYHYRFYQAQNIAGVLESRKFQYQYSAFDFTAGLKLKKKTAAYKWQVQAKVDYQKIPKTSAQKNFAAALSQSPLALDLLDQNRLNEQPLFDSKDLILPKEITKFSLRLTRKKPENSFVAELSRVYDFLSRQTTTDTGDYLFVLPKNRENSYSLGQYWLAWHLTLKWRLNQNFRLAYFTRQDTLAGKNLAQNWKIMYKNLSLVAYDNRQAYTNYDGENFFEKKQLVFTTENPLFKKWSSKLVAKRNYLLANSYDDAYFLGKHIDELSLSLKYQDCCSELELSFFEKLADDALTRGLAINFNLISGF